MPTHIQGLVAILDALGAAMFTDAEIDTFLESRSVVLEKLNEGAEKRGIDRTRLRVFTFNDTIVIVYLAANGGAVVPEDIMNFAIRLRAFMMHGFQHGVLFRGSLSVGLFRRVDDKTNTIMGPAVSDAAAWYDKADWVGIAATPHATMFIQSVRERQQMILGLDIDAFLVDYDVPIKEQRTLKLKAINWPKAFFVKGLRPKVDGNERSMLLNFLSQHRAPRGTESKYFNTLAFFDHVLKVQKPTERLAKKPKP